MKKMMTGVAAITMMFATACSNEEIVKVDDSQEVFTVTATKGIDSRLEMKDGSLVWSDGDKLYVFGEGVDGFLTLISGAGTKTGTFVGRISGSAANLTNAVFGDDVKVEGGKVKISLENQSTEECDAPMDGRFSADKGSISLTIGSTIEISLIGFLSLPYLIDELVYLRHGSHETFCLCVRKLHSISHRVLLGNRLKIFLLT